MNMTVPSDNNLFKSAKFVYILSKYLGYLSYQSEQRQENRLKASNFHLAAWSLLQTAFTGLQIYFTAEQMYDSLASFSTMEFCFYTIYYAMQIVTLFTVQISSKIYNGKFLDILNKLMEIEENLKTKRKMSFKRVYFNIAAWILISMTAIPLLFNFLVLSIFATVSLIVYTNITIIIFATYSSYIVPTLLFSTTLCAFNEILHQINDGLQRNLVINSPRKLLGFSEDFADFMRDISSSCQDIFEGVRSLRQIFGLTILCMSGVTFSVIVCHIYGYTFLRYVNVDTLSLTNWSILLVYFSVVLGIYIIICEVYVKEVS